MRYGSVAFTLLAAILLLASLAGAQTNEQITAYDFKVYPVGNSSTPVASALAVPASAVLCNQTALTSTNTLNPNLFAWDDPVNAGKVCIYTPPTTGAGAILALPNGNYQGSVTAINAAGSGAESALAPFSRLSPPAARTGVRIIR